MLLISNQTIPLSTWWFADLEVSQRDCGLADRLYGPRVVLGRILTAGGLLSNPLMLARSSDVQTNIATGCALFSPMGH